MTDPYSDYRTVWENYQVGAVWSDIMSAPDTDDAVEKD